MRLCSVARRAAEGRALAASPQGHSAGRRRPGPVGPCLPAAAPAAHRREGVAWPRRARAHSHAPGARRRGSQPCRWAGTQPCPHRPCSRPCWHHPCMGAGPRRPCKRPCPHRACMRLCLLRPGISLLRLGDNAGPALRAAARRSANLVHGDHPCDMAAALEHGDHRCDTAAAHFADRCGGAPDSDRRATPSSALAGSHAAGGRHLAPAAAPRSEASGRPLAAAPRSGDGEPNPPGRRAGARRACPVRTSLASRRVSCRTRYSTYTWARHLLVDSAKTHVDFGIG